MRLNINASVLDGVVCGLENNHVTKGRSYQTALNQRELIGCIGSQVFTAGVDVVRIAPTSAKLALTGSGKADKKEPVTLADGSVVRPMYEYMYEYPGAPERLTVAKREAVADALGVAIAGVEKWEADNG